jgi:hypothetical protein
MNDEVQHSPSVHHSSFKPHRFFSPAWPRRGLPNRLGRDGAECYLAWRGG